MLYRQSVGHLRKCEWHQGVQGCWFLSVQFSSVAQSCPTLCDPTNRSIPGLPVHHQLPEFTQTHVHRVISLPHQPRICLRRTPCWGSVPSSHSPLQWRQKDAPEEAVDVEPRAGALLSCAGCVMHRPSILLLSQPGEGWHTLPSWLSSFFLHPCQDVRWEGIRKCGWRLLRCVGDLPFLLSFMQLRCFNFSSASCIFAEWRNVRM